MRCPSCEHENVPGDELCVECGHDLLDAGLPRARSGMQARIFADPLSVLDPAAPITVTRGTSAAEAIRLMKERRYGSVFVLDGDRLAGIFTERDVLMKLAGRAVDPAKTTVGDLMTPEPATLNLEDPLSFAIHLMAVRGLRHIPILKDGKPMGVVSIRGILSYLTSQAL